MGDKIRCQLQALGAEHFPINMPDKQEDFSLDEPLAFPVVYNAPAAIWNNASTGYVLRATFYLQPSLQPRPLARLPLQWLPGASSGAPINSACSSRRHAHLACGRSRSPMPSMLTHYWLVVLVVLKHSKMNIMSSWRCPAAS